MKTITEKRRDEIAELYHSLNGQELEYFLCLSADRIGVPVEKGDHVDYQQALYFSINGGNIDLITREFQDEIDKRRDEQINNLLEDE
jgi:hypothetical protein